MFTRRRGKVGGATGDWSLTLVPGTHQTILETLDPYNPGNKYGHVVITPGRVDPNTVDPLTVARYTGRLVERSSDGLSISGDGIEGWLGDADDAGNIQNASTDATDAFEDWWTTWDAADLLNGLTLGDVEALGGAHKIVELRGLVTVRPLADRLCRLADAEWRANPDATVDAGSVTYLYGADPVAVLARDAGTGDPHLPGLPVTSWGYTADQQEWFTGTYVPYNNDANFNSSTVTPLAKRLDGADVIRERVIDGNDTTNDTTSAQDLADKEQDAMGTRIALGPSVDVWDIGRIVEPGHKLYVYDPTLGLRDPDSQIPYRGRLIFPLVLRVHAVSQPFRQGMGAYYRAPDATGTYTDFTEWVAPESGDATLEVGAPRRRPLVDRKRRGEAA